MMELYQFTNICLVMTLRFMVVSSSRLPNIVLLLADDLGYGDIGRFGNTTLRTPNIDQIGKDGATLTQHLASDSMCTPSRASFLTGRYPVRSGMTSQNDLPVIPFLASQAGLPTSEITFANVAKKAGYKTALIGKWHLGWNCKTPGDHCHHPNKYGFDYFYGCPLSNMPDFDDRYDSVFNNLFPGIHIPTICFTGCVFSILFTGTLLYFNVLGNKSALLLVFLLEIAFLLPITILCNVKLFNGIIFRQDEIVEQPLDLKTMTPKVIRESIDFIESAQSNNEPFMLFLSLFQPHTALVPMYESIGRTNHGTYGDIIEEMDWSIGEIIKFIDDKGITDNTFIYFASDNGGMLSEFGPDGDVQGGHNGIFKGGKSYGVVDGGVRVPAVIKWPGRIPAGFTINTATSLMDIFPTVAHLSQSTLPENTHIDGRNLLPLLTLNTSDHHEFLFHYVGKKVAAVRYMPKGTSEIYKLVYMEHESCVYICKQHELTTYSPPHLRALHDDPTENEFIDIQIGSKYGDIISLMDDAKREHERSVFEVEPQMTLSKLIWRPWLQPCCSLSFCRCKDSKYSNSHTDNVY